MDTVQFSIRIPSELNERIKQRAKYTRRSRNSEIIRMLEEYLKIVDSNDEKALRALERFRQQD